MCSLDVPHRRLNAASKTQTSQPDPALGHAGPPASTTPAPSWPGIWAGSTGVPGRVLLRDFQSVGFTPERSTRSRTSPGPGSGSGLVGEVQDLGTAGLGVDDSAHAAECYLRSRRRFSRTGSTARTRVTASRSRSMTRRSGSGAQLGEHRPVRGDHAAVPDAGRRARRRSADADGARVGLAGGHHEAGAVQRPGPGQQLPLLDLARAGTPGGGQARRPRAPRSASAVNSPGTGRRSRWPGRRRPRRPRATTSSSPGATVADSAKPNAS